MTEIVVYSLLHINASQLQTILSGLGYGSTVHEEGLGKIRLSTSSNMTQGHKDKLQLAIDAVGYGIIN